MSTRGRPSTGASDGATPTVSAKRRGYRGCMKTLLRIALAAALARVCVNLLKKQRSQGSTHRATHRATSDLVADTNMVHGGDPAGEQRAAQPQDWRGAQNVLDS
jgi:hypothetical protein